MNKVITTSVIALSLLVQTSVSAQEASTTPKRAPVRAGISETLKARKADIEARKEAGQIQKKAVTTEIKDLRTGLREEHKDIKGMATSTRKDAREEFRANASTTRKEIKDLREERKEIASTTRNEIKKYKAETKEQIKNQFKLNTDKVIERLTSELKKLADKKNSFAAKISGLKTTGVDTGVLEQKISDVETKIIAAGSAIEAVKTFKPEITKTVSENSEALKTETKAKIEELKKLVTTAQESLKTVHKALTDMVPELRKSMATSTASTSN